MNGDALLYWLSYLETGTWGKLKSTLHGYEDGELDLTTLRSQLSDLGFADFFVNGTKNWKVCQPQLVGLYGAEMRALFIGARCPKIVEDLKKSAQSKGVLIETQPQQNFPSHILLEGDEVQIKAIAENLKLGFRSNWAKEESRKLPSVIKALGAGDTEPIGWDGQSFDLSSKQWVKEKLMESARWYKDRYGRSKFYFADKDGNLWTAKKREAVYISAWKQKVKIAHYDSPKQELRVPYSAPLPELFARVACLCSGIPSKFIERHIVYTGVTQDVATRLLVLVGQPQLELHWC